LGPMKVVLDVPNLVIYFAADSRLGNKSSPVETTCGGRESLRTAPKSNMIPLC